MIDESDTTKFEEQSQTIGLMTFLNKISLFLLGLSFSLQMGRGENCFMI